MHSRAHACRQLQRLAVGLRAKQSYNRRGLQTRRDRAALAAHCHSASGQLSRQRSWACGSARLSTAPAAGIMAAAASEPERGSLGPEGRATVLTVMREAASAWAACKCSILGFGVAVSSASTVVGVERQALPVRGFLVCPSGGFASAHIRRSSHVCSTVLAKAADPRIWICALLSTIAADSAGIRVATVRASPP